MGIKLKKQSRRVNKLVDVLKKYHINLNLIINVCNINRNTLYSWISRRRNGDLSKEDILLIASRLKEAASLLECIAQE